MITLCVGIPYWKDEDLLGQAIASVKPYVDHIETLSGGYVDQPHDEGDVIWETEAGKRNYILDRIKDFHSPGWLLNLDSDETLIMGNLLKPTLELYQELGYNSYPIRYYTITPTRHHVLFRAPWKCFYYDDDTSFHQHCYVIKRGAEIIDMSPETLRVADITPGSEATILHRPYLRPLDRQFTGSNREGYDRPEAI